MSDPVRFGLLSTARINDKLVAGARESEAVSIVAVASRDGETAGAYARERSIGRAHGSYEALLSDNDVEAVYISLPNGLHLEWSIRALAAGKHVLCEKPLGRSAEAVGRAFDVADREGRLLVEAFMYRHNPQTKRLATLVADGAIGTPRLIRTSFSFRADDPADPRLRRELEGGALMDVGCYCVSAARLLFGEPLRVAGEQRLGGDGVDVAFAGLLGFDGELMAGFDCGITHEESETLVVLGEEGSLHVADPWHCRRTGIELRRGGSAEQIAVAPVNSYTLELEDLAVAIREGRPPLLGRVDAVGQARTIEALYAAADQQRTVTL